MKRWLALLTIVPALTLSARAEPPTLLPQDAVWGIVFDTTAVVDSELSQQAWNSLAEPRREKILDKVDGLSQILGLDLTRDIGRIAAFGTGYAPQDMALVAEIGPQQTNLEGLFLAGKSYQSADYGQHLIHSIQQSPERPRVYGVVVPGSDQRPGLFIASPGLERTKALVDQADLGAHAAAESLLGQNEYLRMWVASVPDEMLAPNSRQSNIAAMIKSIELVGHTGPTQGDLTLNLHMVDDGRARTLLQMASGFKAMIEFAAAEDAEAAKLADLLAYVSMDQPDAGSTVRLQAKVTKQDVDVFLNMLDRAGAFRELDLD